MAILEIRNLNLVIKQNNNIYPVLKDINLSLEKGQTIALVGESGCGKTMTAMSVLKLLPNNSQIISGEILYKGHNIINYSDKDMQNIRGRQIALIPQDPMTSLNPLYTIENQLVEVLEIHKNTTRENAKKLALEALDMVKIPNAKERLKSYPHELSGGMKQRIIIAMALSTGAEIIIADEPTTALDVTVQAQIMNLLNNLQNDFSTSIILITHDLGLVYQNSDFVNIMYAGKIVEANITDNIFNFPKHPYTKALLNSLPTPDKNKLQNIKGQPPKITDKIDGCNFYPRCDFCMDICKKNCPTLTEKENNSKVACWLCV